MKKTTFTGILVANLILLGSCGGKQKDVTKTNQDSTNQTTTSNAPNTDFNSNLSLTLTESKADKLGFSVGLPDGWRLEEGGIGNGNQSYDIMQGERTILNIFSEKAGQTARTSEDLGYYEDAYTFLTKEDLIEQNGFKRTGVIVKSKDASVDPSRLIEMEYFLSYSNGKFGYLNIQPGYDEGFTSKSIDTCYAVIKSFKQL